MYFFHTIEFTAAAESAAGLLRRLLACRSYDAAVDF